MPVYSVRNNESLDEFEVTMKYDEFLEYIEANPNLTQIFTRFPGYVDSVRIGIRKVPDSFNDVLAKAKNAHKHSTIEY